MRRSGNSENLAHSFTDLMTSLMVIFILLLLVFLNNRAGENAKVTNALLQDMKQQLEPAGLKGIQVDPNDPYTIIVPVSGEKLTFQANTFQLMPGGETFLKETMPALAKVVCADKYRASVETVIVEGHSDNAPYRGLTLAQSRGLNLKLSQDRAMEVVQKTLVYLDGMPAESGCLLEKLSANGRGEQDLEPTADKSRRVVLKIRVNAAHGAELMRALAAKRDTLPPPPPQPSPAAAKVVDVLDRLQSVPKQAVQFELTEREINEYLDFALKRTPRPGIDAIAVKIFPANYIASTFQIDQDVLARSMPEGISTIFGAMTSGKTAAWVDWRFQVQNGRMTFSIEKSTYGEHDLPSGLVRKLIAAVAALQPEHYDTEKPMELPFGVRKLETAQGVIRGEN